MAFFRVEAKWFGLAGRLFERDDDDVDPEMVVLGDNSDIPEGDGCSCGGGEKPDMRMGFRKQVTRA